MPQQNQRLWWANIQDTISELKNSLFYFIENFLKTTARRTKSSITSENYSFTIKEDETDN